MDNPNHAFSLSVIIPTLNEEKNIATVISQFKALGTAFRYEVLIGDGGSTDRTIQIAAQLGAQVVPDTTGNNTIASGRDESAKAASGDIFIFCDADTRLSDVLTLAREIEIIFRIKMWLVPCLGWRFSRKKNYSVIKYSTQDIIYWSDFSFGSGFLLPEGSVRSSGLRHSGRLEDLTKSRSMLKIAHSIIIYRRSES